MPFQANRHSLLVLGCNELIRLTVSPELGLSRSRKIQAPGGRLLLVPGKRTALVLHVPYSIKPSIKLLFMLFSTSSLSLRKAWEHSLMHNESEANLQQIMARRGQLPVQCSMDAVAVCVAARTLLFDYKGAVLATLPGVSGDLRFTSDGFFLAGLVGSEACIWDARSGSMLVKLPGADSVAWGLQDRLNVSSLHQGSNLVFQVLQFG